MHLGRLNLRKESACEFTDISYCSCVILLFLLSSCIDLVEMIAFELLGSHWSFLFGSSKRRKRHLWRLYESRMQYIYCRCQCRLRCQDDVSVSNAPFVRRPNLARDYVLRDSYFDHSAFRNEGIGVSDILFSGLVDSQWNFVPFSKLLSMWKEVLKHAWWERGTKVRWSPTWKMWNMWKMSVHSIPIKLHSLCDPNSITLQTVWSKFSFHETCRRSHSPDQLCSLLQQERWQNILQNTTY